MESPIRYKMKKPHDIHPKAHNVLILIDITSCKGGYAAVMPLASLISSTCGDIHLNDSYIRSTDVIEDDEPYNQPDSPLRRFLRGTDDLFLHLVTDAGFA